MFCKGVFDKLIKVIDALCLRFFTKSRTFKTIEDVRNLMDLRLSRMGGWYGFVNFTLDFGYAAKVAD